MVLAGESPVCLSVLGEMARSERMTKLMKAKKNNPRVILDKMLRSNNVWKFVSINVVVTPLIKRRTLIFESANFIKPWTLSNSLKAVSIFLLSSIYSYVFLVTGVSSPPSLSITANIWLSAIEYISFDPYEPKFRDLHY